MHRARTGRLLFQEALELVRSATLQVEDAAVRETAEASDAIIAEHLRPAFHETMHRAGEAARRLGAYIDDEFRLDTARIITASLKVRNATSPCRTSSGGTARSWLPESWRTHSDRAPRSAIAEVCVRSSSVHVPLQRRACTTTSSRVRRSPRTTPPPLWLLSDEAAAGRPWLPTVAEQDAAWRTQLGRPAYAPPLVTAE